MRNIFILRHDNPDLFMSKVFEWSKQFSDIAFYNNSQYTNQWADTEFHQMLAVDALNTISANANGAFEQLDKFANQNPDWMFGYLSYDLKNDLELLPSQNIGTFRWPELYFFIPKFIFFYKNDLIEIHSFIVDCQDIINEIEHIRFSEKSIQKAQFRANFRKSDYLKNVELIKQHIENGDIYEMNYCVEFTDFQADISPFEIYSELMQNFPVPFSSFFKHQNAYIISASPERFLKKKGQKLLSQPIKGTAQRHQSAAYDEIMKTNLRNNTKEIAENVMIADLVRNDLSRVAEKGSVKVDELAGLYSYPTVHQLISTISAQLAKDKTWLDAIKACFPMGSMTGAPKVAAMKLIENFENTKRGVYSGALGYISPDRDFDFNVLIRTALYDAATKHLSVMVGGAITALSIPGEEFEECLIKINFWFRLLNTDGDIFS